MKLKQWWKTFERKIYKRAFPVHFNLVIWKLWSSIIAVFSQNGSHNLTEIKQLQIHSLRLVTYRYGLHHELVLDSVGCFRCYVAWLHFKKSRGFQIRVLWWCPGDSFREVGWITKSNHIYKHWEFFRQFLCFPTVLADSFRLSLTGNQSAKNSRLNSFRIMCIMNSIWTVELLGLPTWPSRWTGSFQSSLKYQKFTYGLRETCLNATAWIFRYGSHKKLEA